MHARIVISILAWNCAVASQAIGERRWEGTPTELASYLSGIGGRIVLSAEAERRVEANQAVVQLQAKTEDKLLKRALEKNQELRNEIVQALEEAGVEKSRVEVSKLSSIPRYGLLSKDAKAYEIVSQIQVRAKSEQEMQLVAGLVDSRRELAVQQIRFEHTEEDSLRLQVIREALAKVMAQKKVYEEQLGASLRPRGEYSQDMLEFQPTVAGSTTRDAISSGELAPPIGSTFMMRKRALSQQDYSQLNQIVYSLAVSIVIDVVAK